MDGIKNYWLEETYRHLELALLGASGKAREQINDAIESLKKYEQELKNEKNN